MNNNNLSLGLNQSNTSALFAAIVANLQKPLQKLADSYSSILEQPINTRQARALLNAQLAFFATVMPATCPLLLRVACCVWLVCALHKCRELL